MDDSSSLSSLNSADFIFIGKEQPRLRVPPGKLLDALTFERSFSQHFILQFSKLRKEKDRIDFFLFPLLVE